VLDDWGLILAGTADFCLLQNVQTSSRTHPAAYSVGTGHSFRGVKLPGMNLTTDLLRLRISGVVPLIPCMCLHDVCRDNCTCTFTWTVWVLALLRSVCMYCILNQCFHCTNKFCIHLILDDGLVRAEKYRAGSLRMWYLIGNRQPWMWK
jgi:hypothetical protein